MEKVNQTDIELLQLFPMRMQVRKNAYENDESLFTVKFSNDDFFNEGNFIPVSVLMELLGQSAETRLRMDGCISKKYLAQVVEFRVDPEMMQMLGNEFHIGVKVLRQFGNFNKTHAMLVCNGKKYCEGVYVHYNV